MRQGGGTSKEGSSEVEGRKRRRRSRIRRSRRSRMNRMNRRRRIGTYFENNFNKGQKMLRIEEEVPAFVYRSDGSRWAQHEGT